MTDAPPQPDDSIDVRLLARQDLPHEAFPGGRNEGFRVYLHPRGPRRALEARRRRTPRSKSAACWSGAGIATRSGRSSRSIESIRGEGAETRFAEVTFTHQTWAKINAEMDTKFTDLKIVGWYHTHPDFGIFLSDRDRFIQEHFFSGPGQVAHVIDPMRQIEGVFVWRDGKPALTQHFWVGRPDPGGGLRRMTARTGVIAGSARLAAERRSRPAEDRRIRLEPSSKTPAFPPPLD